MTSDLARLWQAHIADRCPKARRELIAAYSPVAKHVAHTLRLKQSSCVEYEDMLGAALLGLIDAIDRYDPSRGVKFETYATWRIRGAVMDMLRSMDWVPRSARRREAALREAYSRLEAELGRAAEDSEVAAALGITQEELERHLQDSGPLAVVSLEDALLGSEGDARITLGESVADPNDLSPQERAERSELKRILADALSSLPDQERSVVTLYYYQRLTLKQIGQVLGVTESRACQIHAKAILRLQARLSRELVAA